MGNLMSCLQHYVQIYLRRKTYGELGASKYELVLKEWDHDEKCVVLKVNAHLYSDFCTAMFFASSHNGTTFKLTSTLTDMIE